MSRPLKWPGSEKRLEEPAADDLEALFGARWPERRLDPSGDVPKSVQRLPALLAADLNVVNLGVRRCPAVGRREADDDQTVVDCLGGLGEGLGKSELCVEVAGGQVAFVVELACVAHPLVDQDQARAVLGEDLAERVAGVRRVPIVGLDPGVGVPASELPRQLAPQRVDTGPVVLHRRGAGRNLGADEYSPACRWHGRPSSPLEDGVDAGEVARLRSREQVVEGEHRVGLAASEVGLELDHRVAAFAVQAPHGAGQHALEAVGQVGPSEELDRIPVLVAPPRPDTPAKDRRRTRLAGSGRWRHPGGAWRSRAKA